MISLCLLRPAAIGDRFIPSCGGPNILQQLEEGHLAAHNVHSKLHSFQRARSFPNPHYEHRNPSRDQVLSTKDRPSQGIHTFQEFPKRQAGGVSSPPINRCKCLPDVQTLEPLSSLGTATPVTVRRCGPTGRVAEPSASCG